MRPLSSKDASQRERLKPYFFGRKKPTPWLAKTKGQKRNPSTRKHSGAAPLAGSLAT
jgi:hypothetical protein